MEHQIAVVLKHGYIAFLTLSALCATASLIWLLSWLGGKALDRVLYVGSLMEAAVEAYRQGRAPIFKRWVTLELPAEEIVALRVSLNLEEVRNLERSIRSIGLALNHTHHCIATDAPEAQPSDVSWRVDHSSEIEQLYLLAGALGLNTGTGPECDSRSTSPSIPIP